jgi:hypothetical protein
MTSCNSPGLGGPRCIAGRLLARIGFHAAPRSPPAVGTRKEALETSTSPDRWSARSLVSRLPIHNDSISRQAWITANSFSRGTEFVGLGRGPRGTSVHARRHPADSGRELFTHCMDSAPPIPSRPVIEAVGTTIAAIRTKSDRLPKFWPLFVPTNCATQDLFARSSERRRF